MTMTVTCAACGAEFESQERLDEHVHDAHPETETVRCAACGAEFESQMQLDEHVRSAHG